MTAYLVNILLITIYAMFLIYSENATEHHKKIFIFLASVQWIFLSGLRAMTVGDDTLSYRSSFLLVQKSTWKDLINKFIAIYIYGEQGKDPGYTILEKLCGSITQNYQVFLFIIAIFFGLTMGYSIYKNSSDPYISFLIYSCLFYSFFSITGCRQTIATALMVFIGYELIKKRKIIPFIAIALIAATIHKSSLIFLIMYPLYKLDISKKTMNIALIAIILAFIFRSELLSLMNQISGYEYAYIEGAKGITFVFLLCLVTLFSYISREGLSNQEIVSIDTPHYVIAILIATFFCPLILENPGLMRVVQYFSLFLMFLIPEYFAVIPEDKRVITWIVFVCTIIFLFINGHPVYRFFWQVA